MQSQRSAPLAEDVIKSLGLLHHPEFPTDEPVALRTRVAADARAPNDLRSYLQRRAVLRRTLAKHPRRKAWAPVRLGDGWVEPVRKSLQAVLDHVHTHTAKATPWAILVVPAATSIDATGEAIQIARALVSGKQRTVLVDLTRGASAVSGPLGLPRAPGFTNLAAGRVGFEDVVHIDDQTPLQVIPAGNPKVQAAATDGALRIIEALTRAYDCIVMHIDPTTARQFQPVLEGRLQVVVCVLAPGESAELGSEDLVAFTALGCSVVPYQQVLHPERSGRWNWFGRAAAI